jgi:DNA-binding NarL/FixJ family response regulator
LIKTGILAAGLTLRIGLREVLRGLAEVEVAAEADSAENLPPVDVLVLASADFLDELDGGTAPAVLLLTNEPEDAARLEDFPVWGILPLEAGADELSAAVHALAEGLWVGSPALARRFLRVGHIPVLEGADEVMDPPTERERQVLQLTAEGLANKQIAAALEISENTVKFHLSSLYAKLGVASRTEAVRQGARKGWVVL